LISFAELPGRQSAGVNRPEHVPLAECRRGTDKPRGGAAAGRPEQSRLRAELGQNLFAERDLIAEKLRRQLRERWYLRMVVAVVSDRHPQPQLLPHQVGVCLREIADHEEGRANPQLGQRRENARRVLRRGAVVEGQGNGPLHPRRPARAEPHRDQLVREGAADDHLLARRAAEGELRVARRAAGHADDAADERLPPVVTVDDGDPVAACATASLQTRVDRR